MVVACEKESIYAKKQHGTESEDIMKMDGGGVAVRRTVLVSFGAHTVTRPTPSSPTPSTSSCASFTPQCPPSASTSISSEAPASSPPPSRALPKELSLSGRLRAKEEGFVCNVKVNPTPSQLETVSSGTVHSLQAQRDAEMARRKPARQHDGEYRGAKYETRLDPWRRQAEIDAVKRVSFLLMVLSVGICCFYRLLELQVVETIRQS